MYIYTQYKYIYIYIRVHITCYFGIKRGPWQTEGRRGRRFRFDETRRDNYLESGGTAGTGGEKDATHSVAEAGQAWTDDGVETRLDAGYHHRRSTRLEPTRVDAAAAAAATAAMPLSLSPRGCTGGAVAITEETLRTGRKNDWWLDAVAILVKIRPEGKKGYWLYRPRWNISRNIGWIILRGIRKACGYTNTRIYEWRAVGWGGNVGGNWVTESAASLRIAHRDAKDPKQPPRDRAPTFS